MCNGWSCGLFIMSGGGLRTAIALLTSPAPSSTSWTESWLTSLWISPPLSVSFKSVAPPSVNDPFNKLSARVSAFRGLAPMMAPTGREVRASGVRKHGSTPGISPRFSNSSCRYDQKKVQTPKQYYKKNVHVWCEETWIYAVNITIHILIFFGKTLHYVILCLLDNSKAKACPLDVGITLVITLKLVLLTSAPVLSFFGRPGGT